MRDKSLLSIEAIKGNLLDIEKEGPFNLLSVDDFGNGQTAPRINVFITLAGMYEQYLTEENLNEEETKELDDIKDIITRIFDLLDFSNYDDPKLFPYYLNLHYRELFSKWPVDKTDSSIISDMVNELFGDRYNEYKDYYYQVVLLTSAYIYANLLIKRKELTEELYLMMAPHLYPSEYHAKKFQFLPLIKYETFENDYEWSKGNAENIALILSVENEIDSDCIEEVFGISLGDDGGDSGDSPSPELVDV